MFVLSEVPDGLVAVGGSEVVSVQVRRRARGDRSRYSCQSSPSASSCSCSWSSSRRLVSDDPSRKRRPGQRLPY